MEGRLILPLHPQSQGDQPISKRRIRLWTLQENCLLILLSTAPKNPLNLKCLSNRYHESLFLNCVFLSETLNKNKHKKIFNRSVWGKCLNVNEQTLLTSRERLPRSSQMCACKIRFSWKWTRLSTSSSVARSLLSIPCTHGTSVLMTSHRRDHSW